MSLSIFNSVLMFLNLSIQADCAKAEVYFAKLLKDQSKIELKKIHKPRTHKQNRYLHVLFTLYGGEWGLSMDETKIIIKRELGYVYEKHGQMFVEHTSDMDTKRLSEFIDRFRNMSASQGLYLPTADEYGENYFELMKEVDRIESLQKSYSY